MNSTLPPLNTWQFFKSYRKILGETFLTKLFNRGQRQIYRWAADPDFTADNERNPLDRLKVILERLVERGRDDVAQATVAFLAHAVGCELQCIDMADPDKLTVEAECLDDYPIIAEFHEAIRDGKPPEVIRHLWQEAKNELNETYQRAIRGDES